MKKILMIMTSMLLFVGTINPLFATTSEEVTVSQIETRSNTLTTPKAIKEIFPDFYMAIGIKEKLGKSNTSALVSGSELDTITSLIIYEGSVVTSLSGMQYLHNLTSIDIRRSTFSDLTPISRLTNLEYIKFGESEVSDLTPISTLPNVNHLQIGQSKVSDLSPVTNLTKLVYLQVSRSNISDLTPIATLVTLEHLNLSSNNITDLNPIRNLINLRIFSVSNNSEVSDLTPIANLQDLKLLLGSKTAITDLTPILAIPHIEELDFIQNGITDISMLDQLPDLKFVRMFENAIMDASAVKHVDEVMLHRQEITLPTQNFNHSFELSVDVWDRDGNHMEPTSISDGGVYNEATQTITWETLDPQIEQVSYIFGDPSATSVWNMTGTVTQPLAHKLMVTFDTDGGTEIAPLTDVEVNTTITAPVEPTKDGFVFTGWYKEPVTRTENATTRVQVAEQTTTAQLWNFDTDVVTEDMVLYASWEAEQVVDVLPETGEHTNELVLMSSMALLSGLFILFDRKRLFNK